MNSGRASRIGRVVRAAAHCLAFLIASPALGQSTADEDEAIRRYAIVIGNGDYQAVEDLDNAVADAQLMGSFLRSSGYTVVEGSDLTKAGFESLFRRILRDVDRNTDVVLYYAGHGMQIGTSNYLLPVDADLNDVHDAPFEAVSLDSLIQVIGSRARSQVAIFDSCRNNPFEAFEAASGLSGDLVGTRIGFSFQSTPLNALLAFATSPGALAYDGAGDHSPYTAALVETALDMPQATIGGVLERVRSLVYARTDGAQIPWESSTLLEPVSFGVGGAGIGQLVAGTPGRGTARSPVVAAEAESGDVTEADTQDAADLYLATQLERQVNLGPALLRHLGDDDPETVEVAAGPTLGRLTFSGADGRRIPVRGQKLDRSQVATLRYEVNPFAGRSGPSDGAAMIDRFSLAGAGSVETVQLRMTPNACDVEAGDLLDPGGVGPSRYPHELDPDRALAACEAAVAARPGTARFHYQLGRALKALTRFDEAEVAFQTALDLGHARAHHAIGLLIDTGDTTAGGFLWNAAPPEALAAYEDGVRAGDPFAYYSLGRQLLRFASERADRERGFRLLSRALEFGHTYAMNELGAFFIDPENPFNDGPRGMRYLRESAERGDIYGYNNLGLAYRDGTHGGSPDAAQAAAWFERAAEAGHPVAPTNLGRLHAAGALGTADYVAAARWYRLGLERGDPWGGANGAAVVFVAKPEGSSPFEAAELAAKAAMMGNANAAAAAEDLLARLSPAVLNGGAQIILGQLGAEVAVDGAFGPGSEAALASVLSRLAAASAPTDPADRVKYLARLYFLENPFRSDLF